MSTRTFTFEERLHGALHAAQERPRIASATGAENARELALVVTKLEEAVMWNDAARVKAGLDPLGLDWGRR